MNEERQTLGSAVAALVFGILSLILLGPLAAIPAIILGHVAIARSGRVAPGRGMGVAGLIMGYLSLFFSVVFVALLLTFGLSSLRRLPGLEGASRHAPGPATASQHQLSERTDVTGTYRYRMEHEELKNAGYVGTMQLQQIGDTIKGVDTVRLFKDKPIRGGIVGKIKGDRVFLRGVYRLRGGEGEDQGVFDLRVVEGGLKGFSYDTNVDLDEIESWVDSEECAQRLASGWGNPIFLEKVSPGQE